MNQHDNPRALPRLDKKAMLWKKLPIIWWLQPLLATLALVMLWSSVLGKAPSNGILYLLSIPLGLIGLFVGPVFFLVAVFLHYLVHARMFAILGDNLPTPMRLAILGAPFVAGAVFLFYTIGIYALSHKSWDGTIAIFSFFTFCLPLIFDLALTRWLWQDRMNAGDTILPTIRFRKIHEPILGIAAYVVLMAIVETFGLKDDAYVFLHLGAPAILMGLYDHRISKFVMEWTALRMRNIGKQASTNS